MTCFDKSNENRRTININYIFIIYYVMIICLGEFEMPARSRDVCTLQK
jgi:hypothetical protein